MPFNPQNPGDLSDADLKLHLTAIESAEDSIWKAQTYRFEIQSNTNSDRLGHINLRIGQTELLTRYVGHIGYSIDEAHRGHHYAERACRILLPFAAYNGLKEIWITCSPDNPASRRTLERLGADFVEIVDVPDDYPLPDGALRQKCRYRIVMPSDTINPA